MCNIHYTANPEASDRNHFDNPVYSFGSTIRDEESPLNNQFINNLKSSNLKKEKLEAYRVEPGFLKGAQGGSILMKNKEADLANPNVYHNPEEDLLDKEDHLYEELKDNAKKLQEETYDHLDYSRPGSSLKTHYHQMPNGIKKSGDSDVGSTISEDT